MLSRIAKYIDYKRISVRAFESSIGASDGMIRRAIKNNTDIQGRWLKNIADIYHDINLEWLITGKGEMLKNSIEGNDVCLGVGNKKNEYQDKKKCLDTQNNFNEKNGTPIQKIIEEKNGTPINEIGTPLWHPNTEIGEFNQTLSMASEEPQPYEKIDLQTERRRELLRGGNAVQILELKDSVISTQKSYIASLEAQLSDIKQDVKELRKDLQEIKKANDYLIKELEKPPKNYAPAWGVAEKPTKR